MKHRQRRLPWIIGFAILALPGGSQSYAQNSPHAVWGKVLNSAKQPPKSEFFQFYAYIKSRPTEVLTHKSFGSGYYEPEGTWWLNAGNFTTEWQIGDTLVVELLSIQAGQVERKTVVSMLTGAGNDFFGNAILERVPSQPDHLTPVELVSFRAAMNADGRVRLSWQTASETNNLGFRIERAAGENGEFDFLAFVAGHGTTSRENRYEFLDRPQQPALYRYRLIQVDHDGGLQVLGTVQVQATLPGGFQLRQSYPNPFDVRKTRQTQFQVYLNQPGRVQIHIYDIRGRLVRSLQHTATAPGRQRISWDGRNASGNLLPAGMYFYEAVFQQQKQKKSLIILH